MRRATGILIFAAFCAPLMAQYSPPGGGSAAFSAVKSGTNASAAMVCASGCSLSFTTGILGLPSASAATSSSNLIRNSTSGQPCYWNAVTSASVCSPQIINPTDGYIPRYSATGGTGSSPALDAGHYSVQGTDTALLTSGTVSGTGASLCTDSNGGATTSGCSGGSTGTFWQLQSNASQGLWSGATVSKLSLEAIYLPYSISGVTKMMLDIQTADGTHSDGICLYDSSGTQKVGLAAATHGSTGQTELTVSSTNLSAGWLYIGVAYNAAAATLRLGGDSSGLTYWTKLYNDASISVTSGACPASITPPADNWQNGRAITVSFR